MNRRYIVAMILLPIIIVLVTFSSYADTSITRHDLTIDNITYIEKENFKAILTKQTVGLEARLHLFHC